MNVLLEKMRIVFQTFCKLFFQFVVEQHCLLQHCLYSGTKQAFQKIKDTARELWTYHPKDFKPKDGGKNYLPKTCIKNQETSENFQQKILPLVIILKTSTKKTVNKNFARIANNLFLLLIISLLMNAGWREISIFYDTSSRKKRNYYHGFSFQCEDEFLGLFRHFP